MPPHIYASGQMAYRDMLNSRRDQSVILMGRSGSGKSVNAKHILSYLTLAAGSINNILTGACCRDKDLQMFDDLEMLKKYIKY